MGSRVRLLLLPALVALAAACGSSTLPPARILQVNAPAQPSHIGFIGEDLVLSVAGENFSAGIIPNAGNPSDSQSDSPRMFVELQGSGVRIALQGTFLSPTLFEGTLPGVPGVYDLSLESGDGTADSLPGAFTMGHRAVTYFVVSTAGLEGESGNANRMDFDLELRAANGELGIWKDEVNLRVVPIGAFATLTTSRSFLVSPGETFEARVTLVDTSVELVATTVDTLPSSITLQQSFATTEFIPGTPFLAKLLPASEAGTSQAAPTFFQIEDQWGNRCAAHLRYDADLVFSGCPGVDAIPNPVVVASNAGFVPVTVSPCPVNAFVNVFWTETTGTNYGNGSTVIDFN